MPQEPKDLQRDPAFIEAEGTAMLELARTLKSLVESPAYGDATKSSWWKSLFG